MNNKHLLLPGQRLLRATDYQWGQMKMKQQMRNNAATILQTWKSRQVEYTRENSHTQNRTSRANLYGLLLIAQLPKINAVM